MQIIQIGSFAILLKWLLLGSALLIALGILKLWLRQTQAREVHKKIIDVVSNSLFLGFILWKGSLIILEPSLVMKNPLSLLYFTGGRAGIFLAIIGSVVFFHISARKNNLSNLFILQSGFIFSFSAISIYHFLALIFLGDGKMSHLILASFTFFLVIPYLFKQPLLSQQRIFTYIILFSFLSLLLSFLQGKSDKDLLIFSIEQWFFVGVIMVSLFYWDKKPVS